MNDSLYKKLDKEGLQFYIDLDKYGLTGFSLKMIALITMVIDHIGVLFMTETPYYLIFRAIGRISFPIFAFLLVEGFFHTSNRRKYGQRLAIFALISEIPYDLVFKNEFFYAQKQNIFFTLLIGYVAIWVLHHISLGKVRYSENLLNRFSFGGLQNTTKMLVMIVALLVANYSGCTYSYAGVFLILCFYVFYEHQLGKAFGNAFFNIGMIGSVQSYGIVSIIPIAFYNGRIGKKRWKWFFYLFYPIHLLILSVLQLMI